MKKLITLLLAIGMMLSIAACGGTATPAASTPAVSTPAASTPAASTPAASTPAASTPAQPEEPFKLTIGLPLKSNVTDYDDNYLTQFFEEKLNCELEFVHFAGKNAEAKTQIAAMVTGKEKLPDIIFAVSLNTQERYMYGQDGYLIDLAPYFKDEKLTADYRARLAELHGKDYFDNMLGYIASPDGKIYTFPNTVVSEGDLPANMVYINQKWLDKLGLQMPRTMDELITVLRAFRDNDCNGNGKRDEIPAIGANGERNRIANWIMNNYVRWHDLYYFNVTDGKVWLPYDTPEFREGLKTINGMVKEGLLSTLSWSMPHDELKNIWTPTDDTAIAGVVAGHISTYTNTDSPVALEYAPLLPLEGSYAPPRTVMPTMTTYITSDCEIPEKAFQFLLCCSSEEGSMAMRYGKEGVDWEWGTDYGTTQEAVHVLNKDAYSGQTKSTWSCYGAFCIRYSSYNKFHTAVDHAPEDFSWTEKRGLIHGAHTKGYMEISAATEPAGSISWIMNYNEQETQELGTIVTDVHTYVMNAVGQFATGELDPNKDADWNEYVKTLQSLGIETWEKVAQSAYDRNLAARK